MAGRSSLIASLARVARAPRLHFNRFVHRRDRRSAPERPYVVAAPEEFALCPSRTDALRLTGPAAWGDAVCAEVNRHALILGDGGSVELPAVTPGPNHALNLVFTLGGGSGGRLDVEFVDAAAPQPLGRFPVSGAGTVWNEVRIALKPLSGRTGTLRLTAVEGTIAVAEATLSREDRLGLARGRGYREIRTRNEIAFFSSVYDHSMYKDNGSGATGERMIRIRPQSEPVVRADDDAMGVLPTLTLPQSADFTSAFDYGHHVLGLNIQSPAPDFAGRLARLAPDRRPLRVLSLCCGAARIERELLKDVQGPLELTLFDLNAELLRQAVTSMPEHWQVDCIQGDINRLALDSAPYDVILCVSALHHVVELERVIAQITDHLAPGGEFWSIGEYIGRRGNRLWPEAYEVADGFFTALPERYRLNGLSGSVDAHLPDFDCSSGCFEGIRSDEIWPLITRRMTPVHVYARNCFLWRLLDLAYTDNYRLSEPDDRALIEHAVALELAHFRAGGRATELHAVFARPPA